MSLWTLMRIGILGFLAFVACGTSQADPSPAPAPRDATSDPPPGTIVLDLDADAVWLPPLHACSQSPTGFMQYPRPPDGPSLTSCPGAGVSGVQITGIEGGPIAPGASAILSVFVENAMAQISYPCLGISADNPDVSFANGGPELYAIVSSVTFSIQVTFGSSIAPGTHVRFAAWVGGWGGNSPDGSTIQCTSGLLEWEVVI